MHLKHLLIPGLAIGLAMLPQASAARPKISTDALQDVDFSAFKTYDLGQFPAACRNEPGHVSANADAILIPRLPGWDIKK